MGLVAVVTQGSSNGVVTVESAIPIGMGIGAVFVCVGLIFMLMQVEIGKQLAAEGKLTRSDLGVLLIPLLFGFVSVLLYKSFKVVGFL